MDDVSPGVAIGGFLGGIAALLKLAVEVIKWRNDKRLRDADARTPMSVRPPPPLHHVQPALSAELKLQAKEVELMRAHYQIDQLTVKLADAERREAQLAARVTEQELLNQQLVDEMARVRREGVSHAIDERGRDRVGGAGQRGHGGHTAGRFLGAPGGAGDRTRR